MKLINVFLTATIFVGLVISLNYWIFIKVDEYSFLAGLNAFLSGVLAQDAAEKFFKWFDSNIKKEK